MPMVAAWLNKDHVRRWYDIPALGVTIDDWLHEIRTRNGEFYWLSHFIATWHGEPIGLCQHYKCEDSDEDFGELPLPGSYGIDYLIGEESHLRKGLGKKMIAVLVERIFSLPNAYRVTASIDKQNIASEKALLSCGFTLFDADRSRYVVEILPRKNNSTEKSRT